MHKGAILLFLFLSLSVSLWYLSKNLTYHYHEPDIDSMLEQKVTAGYLDLRISRAIKAEHFDAVQMYIGLAEMLQIGLLPETVHSIEVHSGWLEQGWRHSKAFATGFVSGQSESVVGLSGSILSDMTLYGDLRDITHEGTKYLDGAAYDTFVLGISLVGVGLSASQLLTVGSTTGLKIGASVLKVAKKTGKLSTSLLKVLSKQLDKTVDIRLLKTLDREALLHPKKASQILARSIDLEAIKPTLKNIGTIKQETSLVDAVRLLKYVDTEQDLLKIASLSKKYKQHTKAVMKVVGKRALHLVKGGLKWTAKLLYGVIAAIFSGVLFLLGLFGKWSLFRKIDRKTSN